jgi:hypothetical protein
MTSKLNLKRKQNELDNRTTRKKLSRRWRNRSSLARKQDIKGEHTASSYGTCGFTPDTEKEGFVAFNELTEASVLEWVQATMDVEALEAGLDAQLEALANPPTVAGMPWTLTE